MAVTSASWDSLFGALILSLVVKGLIIYGLAQKLPSFPTGWFLWEPSPCSHGLFYHNVSQLLLEGECMFRTQKSLTTPRST